jgi:integrase
LRRAQIDGVVGRPEKHSISDALDQWERSGATALRSWQRDMRYKAAVVRALAGDRDIDELPMLSEEIKRWGVEARTSVVNINRHLAIVRRLGNLAERWGWTDKPLGRRVQLLPGERPREMRLSPAQLRKLLSHADPRLADFVAFLTLTGLRRSEALRLTAEDIRANSVHVDHRSKSGRPRIVPLSPEAARIARRSIPFNHKLAT